MSDGRVQPETVSIGRLMRACSEGVASPGLNADTRGYGEIDPAFRVDLRVALDLLHSFVDPVTCFPSRLDFNRSCNTVVSAYKRFSNAIMTHSALQVGRHRMLAGRKRCQSQITRD